MRSVRYCVALSLMMVALAGHSQPVNVDSLRNITKPGNHDTLRAQAFSLLLIHFRSDNDSAQVYDSFNQGMRLTKVSKGHPHYKTMLAARIAMLINVSNFEYNNLGLNESAVKHLDDAAAIAIEIKDSSRLMRAYLNYGILYKRNAQYLLAIDHYQKALDLAQKIKDPTAESDILNNIANIKANLKQHKEAIALHKKALRIRREIDNEFGIAVSLMAIGGEFNDLAQYDSAMYYLQESLNATTADKFPSIYGHTLVALGNLYLSLDDYDNAIKYLNQGLAVRIASGRPEDVYYTKVAIAKAAFFQGNLQQVEPICKECWEYALARNNLGLKRAAADCLDLYYEKTGNYRLAYQFHKEYNQASDSLSAEDRKAEIAQKEIEFEYLRKKMDDSLSYVREQEQRDLQYARDLAVKDQKVETAERTRNFILAGGALLVLFVLYLYRTIRQKQKANKLIHEQKQIIEERHKETTDSINYASRIQQAVLVSDEYLNEMFSDWFVLYQPKDIVSGDFYWAYRTNDISFWAVADCTGHGVPGALMSMIGSAFLNEIIIENKVHDPGQILTLLREKIITSLNKSSDGRMQQDGMDISLVALASRPPTVGSCHGMTQRWAGANNPLLVVRNGELQVHKADKMPVGFYHGDMAPFTTQTLDVQPGDLIYSFSDGIQDQFGGPKAKKLKLSGLQQIIAEHHQKPMAAQKAVLHQSIEQWKGDQEQLDDICMVGVRV